MRAWSNCGRRVSETRILFVVRYSRGRSNDELWIPISHDLGLGGVGGGGGAGGFRNDAIFFDAPRCCSLIMVRCCAGPGTATLDMFSSYSLLFCARRDGINFLSLFCFVLVPPIAIVHGTYGHLPDSFRLCDIFGFLNCSVDELHHLDDFIGDNHRKYLGLKAFYWFLVRCYI